MENGKMKMKHLARNSFEKFRTEVEGLGTTQQERCIDQPFQKNSNHLDPSKEK
jgi:hypothetical protein